VSHPRQQGQQDQEYPRTSTTVALLALLFSSSLMLAEGHLLRNKDPC
jgi:hypothetical protein